MYIYIYIYFSTGDSFHNPWTQRRLNVFSKSVADKELHGKDEYTMQLKPCLLLSIQNILFWRILSANLTVRASLI